MVQTDTGIRWLTDSCRWPESKAWKDIQLQVRLGSHHGIAPARTQGPRCQVHTMPFCWPCQALALEIYCCSLLSSGFTNGHIILSPVPIHFPFSWNFVLSDNSALHLYARSRPTLGLTKRTVLMPANIRAVSKGRRCFPCEGHLHTGSLYEV